MNWRDLLERVIWTAIQAGAGVLAAWQTDSAGVGALVTTAAAILKNVAKQQVEKRTVSFEGGDDHAVPDGEA